MYSYDITRKTVRRAKSRADYNRIAKVYKSMEVNTDPKKKREQPPTSTKNAVATSKVLDEVEGVLHYLQRIITKLRNMI